MNRLRDVNDVKNAQVLEILSQNDPRGGLAPFSPEQKREIIRTSPSRAGRPEAVGNVSDRTISTAAGPLRIRIYHPDSQAGRPSPLLLYFHGGGFISGSLDTHDTLCRNITHRTHAVMVSVDYRLSPEHKYPAALEDAVAALGWTTAHAADLGVDPFRVVVMGDSAGGNLAAVLALKARNEGAATVARQILIYPVIDATLSNQSLVTNALVPPFTLLDAVYMWQQYLPANANRTDPYISPLLATDLTRLPPALIITAEFDILCGEGMAYAARLQESGVEVEVEHFSEMAHGFIQWGATVGAAHAAVERIAQYLRSLY